MRLSVNFWGWLLALLLTGWGTTSHAQFGSGGGWYAPSGDASSTGYTPADGADWADPDPSWVNTALDTLAAAVNGATVPDASGAANGDLLTADGVGSYAWGAPSFISNLVEDLTPQLGGDLDVNGSSLVSASNGDIDIDPDGTGRVTVQSALYCAGDLEFEGSTADGFETTLAVTDPTADRTLTLPDETGTILTGASSANDRIDINGLVADGSPDGAADYAVTWDASASTHRKVLLDDLPGGGGGGGEVNTLALHASATGTSIVEAKSGVALQVAGILGADGVQTDKSGNDVRARLDINGLAADAAPDGTADYVVVYDVSASTHDKVLLNNLPGGLLTTGAEVVAYYAGAGDATDTSLAGSATTTIVFDTETTDTGGDYDNTTGVFTAPKAGMYHYAGQMYHSGNTEFHVVLQVDTGGGYTDFAHGTEATDQPDDAVSVVTGMIKLSSGDKLRFGAANMSATSGRLRGTAYDTGENLTHMSIAWLPTGTGVGISDVVEDTTPQLGGDLDAQEHDIVFEGSTADANELTLTVEDPTADRTITLPDQSGTVVVGAVNTGSAHFDGTNDYFSVAHADAGDLQLSGDFSLMAWVHLRASSTDRAIVGKWGSTAEQVYLFRIDPGANNLELLVSNNGSSSVTYTQVFTGWNADTVDKKWSHVGAVFDVDTDTTHFYVDGYNIGSVTVAIASVGSGNGDFNIGAYDNGSNDFLGQIDEVQIYDSELTAAQVNEAMYRTSSSAAPAGLVSWYRFESGALTTDSAGTTTLTTNGDAQHLSIVPWRL